MNAGKLGISYNIELKRVDHYTDEVIDVTYIKNKIVSNGLERIARRLIADSPTYMKAVALGTGTTPVTIDDTVLETEVARELAVLTYEGSNVIKFYKRFEFTSGESYAISEIGIFDSVIASGSVMFNHALISPAKDVEQGIDLVTTITFTMSETV